jgi:hypothetical protein
MQAAVDEDDYFLSLPVLFFNVRRERLSQSH